MPTMKARYLWKVPPLWTLAHLFPIGVVSSEKDRHAFTQIWHEIWLEEKYAEPGEAIIEEYAKYDALSVDVLVRFLVVPVGTVRFIHNDSEVGLPTLIDFAVEECWSSDDKIIEATLMAVKRGFRRRALHIPALVLMRELARYCRRNGLEGGIMACDERLFYLMRRRLGFPIHQIGQEKFYQGSTTYPAFINTEEFYRVMAEVNPFFTS